MGAIDNIVITDDLIGGSDLPNAEKVLEWCKKLGITLPHVYTTRHKKSDLYGGSDGHAG